MNGLNGSNMPALVNGYPTPAGYQAELAYIYNMVEVLSQQLAENKRALEDVVASVGRVRNRARSQSLGNEELLSSAADDLGSTLHSLTLPHSASMLTFISDLKHKKQTSTPPSPCSPSCSSVPSSAATSTAHSPHITPP